MTAAYPPSEVAGVCGEDSVDKRGAATLVDVGSRTTLFIREPKGVGMPWKKEGKGKTRRRQAARSAAKRWPKFVVPKA